MFEIKEITVTASCSKNYQKSEFSMTATVECDEDIASIKAMCTKHALELLETLPIKEDDKPQVNTTVSKQSNYQVPTNNGARFNAPQKVQYQNNTVRPASQKQLDYLRNAFNYVPQGNITFDEANALLMQFKSQN